MYNHYVVNLETSIDRREHITKIFENTCITPRFFKAIDGKFITDDDRRVDDDGLLRLGEKGCALTHLKILENFLNGCEEYIIIFEDDIELDSRFDTYLPILVDFVKKHKKACSLALYNGNNPHKMHSVVDQHLSIRRSLGFSGTYAYIINKEAAKNILWAQRPLHFEIDSWYTYMKLGLIRLYDINVNLVTPEAPNLASTVDIRGTRTGQVAEDLGRIKDRNIKKIVNKFTFEQKVLFYRQRINKWFWELMWCK
ncbi:glycosyltransferase family 25 protein [Veillonella magna]|uniref:glycosyltransferase family 25 protein n=1 Tax=Veillonella magna TaxID=464322 RepID=UPI0004261E8D|nr:glycosyltransferase family 25 protein [Veillonella magna]